MITKNDLDAANREAEQAHDNAERFRTPVKFTQEEWNQALENVIKLQADLDASQNNLANAEQEVSDLKAKLAQVEKERSEDKAYIEDLCKDLCKMEDVLGFKQDQTDKDGAFVPTIGPWLERVRDLLASEGELGDLRETAKRRLELLWKCEWIGNEELTQCGICDGFKCDGHKSTCALAAELKTTP